MKGLLLKDLLNLKRQGGIILLVLLLYGLVAFTNGMGEVLGSLVAVFGAMLPITALAYDERAKWDKYALTMPVTRHQIVWSKYLLGLMLSAVAFVLNLAIQLTQPSMLASDGVMMALLFFSIGAIFLALIMPLLFKFGTEKARLLMILVVAVPVVGSMGLSQFDTQQAEEVVMTAFKLAPVAAVLLLIVSVWLSMRIYDRKEL